MKWILIRRVLTPRWLVRLYYLWKHGARVSGKAEVDLAGSTSWGPGFVVSPFAKVKIRGPFVVGRRVHIATGCFIDSGEAGLTIGDDVLIGPKCTLVAVTYRFDRLEVPMQVQGTTSNGIRIGHRVRIGANSVVLDGADIGADVEVSSGSVVGGAVPAGSLVAGNPARVVTRP